MFYPYFLLSENLTQTLPLLDWRINGLTGLQFTAQLYDKSILSVKHFLQQLECILNLVKLLVTSWTVILRTVWKYFAIIFQNISPPISKASLQPLYFLVVFIQGLTRACFAFEPRPSFKLHPQRQPNLKQWFGCGLNCIKYLNTIHLIFISAKYNHSS